MRLTIILILSAVLTLNAANAAQSKRVSLNLTGVSFSTLFEEIRKQTNQSFFFNEAKIAELDKISVSKNDVPLNELLNEVLSGTGLSFKFVDGVIVIVDNNEDQGQVMTVSGVVTDASSNLPLPGVTIRLKNSKLGVVTDFDGKFVINLPKKESVLVFSYVGFETIEMKVTKTSELVVQMKEDILSLDEVVVTGYQTIDKRELTSSISEVNAEELNIEGALTVDQMLEGKATGLNIVNVSATPGASAKVRIRGGSTFTGNQSPLWVVDGIIYEDPVPLSAEDINSFDNVNIIGNALTGINPADIEKINILKDASATAIYGTRAANGVIVITTKRGEKGKPRLSYSGGLSYVQAPNYGNFNLMNSKERIDVSREMYARNLGFDGFYNNVDRLGYEGALLNLWDGTYNGQQFANQVYKLETLNTDWFGELYQDSFKQRHSVSASGGGDTSRYYFSLGYDDQNGTERNVNLNRITGRSNIDLDLRDNLLVSLRFSGSVQKAEYNHQSINYFNQAYYTSRTIPLYHDNGDYFYTSRQIFRDNQGTAFGGYNILSETDNSQRSINNKDFTIAATINWKFMKNFRFTSQASYRNTTNLNEEWITEDSFYIAKLRTYDAFNTMLDQRVDIAGMVPFGGIYNGGMVSQEAYTITNQLNYNTRFGDKHTFNVNLGQEARSMSYWGATGFTVPGYNHFQGRGFISLPRVGFNTDENDKVILDFANYPFDSMINWLTPQGGKDIYPTITDRLTNSISVFGILNYVYDNRYILNFNARSDGSNRFGQYERYKFKPAWSTSARWNIHNEKFFEDVEGVEELALRASYGVRGTMPNASPYMIISGFGKNNAIYYPESTANLTSFPNANLRWEKSQTMNFGLNYSLFEGKISGAIDYAYSKSTDLLQSRPISNVNGTDTQLYNSAAKDVNSFEFSIRTKNLNTKDFGWTTRLNFSHDRDRVMRGFESGVENNLTINNYLNGSIYRAGFPTYGFFSYQFDGLNEEGIPTFKHLVEENMTAAQQLEKALVYEGSRVPKFYGGFGTEFRLGRFNLSADWTYKINYKTRLLPLYNGTQNLPLPYENMNSVFVDRWRQPGDEMFTNIPAISNYNLEFSPSSLSDGYSRVYVTNYGKVIPQGTNAWWMYDKSDARVVDASHIRFQAVTLAYSVPKKLIEGAGIKMLRLSVQGSNLGFIAFDKNLKGQDPEQVSGVGMPTLPNYSFSLNMSF
ncbi:SusC/RagA family TonB-linked outer membrane protein [Aestuariibaculum suncheonense]|uniref:SusC/RagA family TonB-linked outer membrane protein n=1 Tax=Aestuariibaculum suncheonense TaxID=1028745 RepID=A0A8J6Q608_9FLAO|nr:SusC/RagA family TonB-linked outer membrane protein [Aestuariibaculum suncheonense]MBD0834385.1 SusC/RagA family TonB-linked outer membrane protein [Aestuariibaculum suncheonense]